MTAIAASTSCFRLIGPIPSFGIRIPPVRAIVFIGLPSKENLRTIIKLNYYATYP
jgi:hypothetical protein